MISRLLFALTQILSRQHKQLVIWLVDLSLPPLALLIACILTFHAPWPADEIGRLTPSFAWVALCGATSSLLCGLSHIKLKSYGVLGTIGLYRYSAAVGLGATAASFLPSQHLPLVGVVAFTMMLFLLTTGSRTALLWLYSLALRHGQVPVRTLIYGAGSSGLQLAAALKAHERIKVVGFLDDDPRLHDQKLAGLAILSPDQARDIVRNLEVERVILAMPSLSGPKHMRLAKRLENLGLEVQLLPSFDVLSGCHFDVTTLQNVTPNRFLNRDQFEHDLHDCAAPYRGQSVLVSGAGGSIGSELCRELLHCQPRQIVLFDISEYALYNVERALTPLAQRYGIQLVPVLGSVTDIRVVRETLRSHQVDVVLHAAAYKHVPLVEANPIVGLVNNVIGTRTLADACIGAGVERFLLISTDKAVRPTNVMGASKRLAEMVVQDLARRHLATRFSIVRFGNVLGSSGSVIPLFQDQIARGGPVTLTHEDVTRYFMTLEEAARLVLIAGSFIDTARLGCADVCVLDMGNPVRIRDLAQQMIEAAGYTLRDAAHPNGDIEIRITGLRPGEKLHEELLLGSGLLHTPHPKIMRAAEDHMGRLHMAEFIQTLTRLAATGEAEAARALALSAVNPALEEANAPLMIAAQ